jgi:glutamate-1-semialdehyde 2,1-aminomutase/spore coat polysaccharide biosynthesis protein SpsF
MRCKRIPGVDEVVCAIPLGDAALRLEAQKYCRVSAGPEDDVLRRYAIAAEAFEADIVVRVTGDCPLISPELCGEVLAMVKNEGVVYASNVNPRSFPKGLDCEAFPVGDLYYADNEATDPYDREHVTPWIARKTYRDMNIYSPWPIAPEGRLCIDTESDYHSICAAFGHAPYEHLHVS